MSVTISPNIKKTSARIDINGNVLNNQGQIVEPLEVQYVPTKEELAKFANAPTEPVKTESKIESDLSAKINSKIEEIINKKIEELVAKKIEEALSKL